MMYWQGKRKAKKTVFLSIKALHRHKAFWKNPDAFNTGRFDADANCKKRCISSLWGWPTGVNRRTVCDDRNFVILATLNSRYQFDFLPDADPDMVITLHQEGGGK